jgi:pyruvate formate lyase activating enzyme
MSLLQANVSKILTFSCVDGPGNRLVIFMQGCNFNCLACHNPHTIGRCDHCGDCIEVCANNALSMNLLDKVVWDPTVCIQCDECINACPRSSSPKTRLYTVDELLAVILENRCFLSGITVSGGEATMQLPFLIELFKAIKEHDDLLGLSCFVDSNGYLSESGWARLLPYLDGAMIDLKAWRNETHQWFTGRSNERVLQSIRYLAAQQRLHEIRLIHIPKIQDLDEQTDDLAAFFLDLPGTINVRLNAFSTHGVTGEAKQWEPCTEEQIDAFAAALHSRGITRLTKTQVFQ